MMKMPQKLSEYVQKVANKEIEAWKLHHRKEYNKLEELGISLFQEFGSSVKSAKK